MMQKFRKSAQAPVKVWSAKLLMGISLVRLVSVH